jgi:hypothetical protein
MTTRGASSDSRSHSHRHEWEVCLVSVDEVVDGHAGELGPEMFGRLQLDMLKALYHELRHGHDQQAAHTRAITKQTEVLDGLAGELRTLRIRLSDR